MQQEALITTFYTAFSKGDANTMTECYHNDIVFEDPAFGQLKGDKAKAMWQMLLSKKVESEMSVSFQVINNSQATWTANYKYGPNKRPVENNVTAHFEFKDGLISKHTDHFSQWKWAKQALGLSGYLLGWSGFMKNKIQATTNKLLSKFMSND